MKIMRKNLSKSNKSKIRFILFPLCGKIIWSMVKGRCII